MGLTWIKHNRKDHLKTEKYIDKYAEQAWQDLKSLNLRVK